MANFTRSLREFQLPRWYSTLNHCDRLLKSSKNHKKYMFKRALIALLLGSLMAAVQAAEMEQNPYDSPNLFGRAVWIGEGESRFPAILGEAAVPESRGLVILMHAEGEHPEWPMVIQSLREGLTDHGWTTLALQLPSPPPGRSDYDAGALAEQMEQRLQMAMDYAMRMDPPLIVLVGHGLAASVALDHARQHHDSHLMAVVGISMRADPNEPDTLNSAVALRELKLPILDISAELDRLEVVNSRQRRDRAARRAGNDEYRQLVIPGADHHFYSHYVLLNKRVRSWLDAQYKKLQVEQLVKKRRQIRKEMMPEAKPRVELPEEPAQPPQNKSVADEMRDLVQEMPPSMEQAPENESTPMQQEKNQEPAPEAEPPSPSMKPSGTDPMGPGGLF